MAAAVITLAVTKTFSDGNLFHVFGTLSISASPATYPTGGLAMPLTDPLIKAQRTPLRVDVTGNNGYIYQYVNGSTNSNGLLKLFSGIGTELGNGTTIPAGESGDTITFHAQFVGML